MASADEIPQGAGDVLLTLASEAVAQRLGLGRVAVRSEPWLAKPGATFVTITINGELRGCIGSLEAWRPLGEDVTQNALAAAFRDPRFAPVSAAEFDSLEFEVSVLSPLTPISFDGESDLLRQLRPGVDGLVLSFGGRRGTFLPQVWEDLPQPAVFLGRLKAKAGLPSDFWDDRIEVSRYTVKKWRQG